MRRVISLALVIYGLLTIATGIWNFFPPFNTMFYVQHVINSCIFGSLLIIHVILNMKSITRYIKGLGWWWILVSLGVLLTIWLGIIQPLIFIEYINIG